MSVGGGVLLIGIVDVSVQVGVDQVWYLVFGRCVVEHFGGVDVVNGFPAVVPGESDHLAKKSILPDSHVAQLIGLERPVTAIKQSTFATCTHPCGQLFEFTRVFAHKLLVIAHKLLVIRPKTFFSLGPPVKHGRGAAGSVVNAASQYG